MWKENVLVNFVEDISTNPQISISVNISYMRKMYLGMMSWKKKWIDVFNLLNVKKRQISSVS